MKSRMTRLSVAALAVTLVALAFASVSFAQNSSVDTYGGSGGNIQSGISDPRDPGDPGASASADPGSLPFTGFDVGIALGAGLILLATGALIARVTPRGGRTS
jgi:hypothetical protein